MAKRRVICAHRTIWTISFNPINDAVMEGIKRRKSTWAPPADFSGENCQKRLKDDLYEDLGRFGSRMMLELG